jgi:hypothetical protein
MFFDLEEIEEVQAEVAAVLTAVESEDVTEFSQAEVDVDYPAEMPDDAPSWMPAGLQFAWAVLRHQRWTVFSEKVVTAGNCWVILASPSDTVRVCFTSSHSNHNHKPITHYNVRIKVNGEERAFEMSLTPRRLLEDVEGCVWTQTLADDTLADVRTLKLTFMTMGRAYGYLTLHQYMGGKEVSLGYDSEAYPAEFRQFTKALRHDEWAVRVVKGGRKSWYRSMMLMRMDAAGPLLQTVNEFPVELVQLAVQEVAGREMYMATVLWVSEKRASVRWACGPDAAQVVETARQHMAKGPRRGKV